MSTPSLLSSGIAGLDVVLGGGINEGSLVMFVGAPGAGKTIMTSQMIFAAARAGLPTLILTAFSESHIKLIEHLRPFAFFDDTLVGDTITILSLNEILDKDYTNVANEMASLIRKSQARLVLIDGFQGLGSATEDAHAMRLILRTLATQISFTGTTLLLTLAGDFNDHALYPQFTIADTIVGLTYKQERRQHTRLIEVVKQRGRAPLAGQHSYMLAKTGAMVYPRLEAFPMPRDLARPTGRAPFGLPELDALMNGGPTAGTTTILAGASGSGRTSLALRWALEHTRPDTRNLYVSFSEHSGELEHKAATLGLDVANSMRSGRFQLLRFSPNELSPDVVGSRLLELLTRGDVERLVIDDINVLIHVLGSRARDFLAALDDLMYGEAISSLLVYEIDPFRELKLNMTDNALGLFDENVLVLQKYQVGGSVHRVLAVLHMRYSTYDRTLREVVIDDRGVHVLSLEETQAGPLRNVIGATTSLPSS